jgi:trehalose-phosphatase
MENGRTRLVVVTGRYLRDCPPELGTRAKPEIWGSHGRERLLPDGRYEVAPIDEFAVRGLTIADAWTPAVQAAGGRSEAKPGSLAFHWRGAGAAQIARIRDIVSKGFNHEALEGVLELHDFDGGMELRAPGLDKGDVIRAILAETAADTPVAYLGDDLTDEDAFNALVGRGLSVLVRPQARKTAADLWIKPPEGLLAFLHTWHQALAQDTT